MSWTTISDATDPSWEDSSTKTRPGWKQLSVSTDDEGGVDFVIKAREQFPMKALDDVNRSLKARDSAFTQGV